METEERPKATHFPDIYFRLKKMSYRRSFRFRFYSVAEESLSSQHINYRSSQAWQIPRSLVEEIMKE